MKTYKIRFYLGSPMLFNAQKPILPLQGDGIYGYAWMLKQGIRKAPSEHYVKNLIYPILPFAKESECYAISASFFPKESFFEETMLLRTADFQKSFASHHVGNASIHSGEGAYRAIRDNYWKLITPYLEFFAKGDIEGIAGLTEIILKFGYLSGKRASGYGKILNAEITAAEGDWSLWRDGQPTRNVPVLQGEKLREGIIVKECGHCPPYWHTGLWRKCYVPPHDMHFPVLIRKPAVHELRTVYWNDAKYECIYYIKNNKTLKNIIGSYLSNEKLIKPDMLPLSINEIPRVYDLKNQHEILEKYLFLAIYKAILRSEKETIHDFKYLIDVEIQSMTDKIKKYDETISLYEYLLMDGLE